MAAARGTGCSPPSSAAHTPSPTCSKLSTGEAESSSKILQGRLTSSGKREGVLEMKGGISQLSRRNQAWRQMSLVSSQHMGRKVFLWVPAATGLPGIPRSLVPAHRELSMCPELCSPRSCSTGPLPEQALQGELWGGGERGCCLSQEADQQLSWQIRWNLFANACSETGFFVTCKAVISDPGFLSLSLLKYCSADLVERQCVFYQEWRETWEHEEGKAELTFSYNLQSSWWHSTPQQVFKMKTIPISPDIPTREVLP